MISTYIAAEGQLTLYIRALALSMQQFMTDAHLQKHYSYFGRHRQ